MRIAAVMVKIAEGPNTDSDTSFDTGRYWAGGCAIAIFDSVTWLMPVALSELPFQFAAVPWHRCLYAAVCCAQMAS